MDMRLMTGDSAVMLKQIDDESIDLTVTSPPYDNIRDYHGYTFDFEAIANELWRVTKQGGVVVWIVADATIDGSETGTSFRQALYFKDIGFNLHDTMVWSKDGFPFPEEIRYPQTFEYMFILSKGKPKTVNIIKDRPNKRTGQYIGKTTERLQDGTLRKRDVTNRKTQYIGDIGCRFNVWDIAAEHNNKTGHPAVFPFNLARDHILSWSNKGDTVLDPFLGSGTTGLAAYDTGREFVGIEISEEYMEIAKKRINDAMAQVRWDL